MRIILIIVLLFNSMYLLAQDKVYTIEQCQEMAQRNYPVIKNYNLIAQSTNYSLSNAAKIWIPQVTLSAQASYQSAVAAFPAELMQVYQNMGIEMKGLNKDQYKAALDIYQNIWDGGQSRAEKRIAEASQKAEIAQTQVELYNVKDRINNLFFGILLAKEQGKQNLLQQDLLESNLKQVQAYYDNGTAMQSDIDAIEAEYLSTKQQYVNIKSAIESYKTMLSIFTGVKIDSIQTPDLISIDTKNIQRPELEYYQQMSNKFASQEYSIKSSTAPRIGLSFQGFYGNPGLNLFKDMADDKFTWNYVAGLKFQWSFGGYYTKKNKLSQIDIARQQTNIQQETFIFNTNLQIAQQEQEINKYEDIIKDDDKIITLRTSVREAFEAKLNNGIIDITDLLRQITLESNAKLNKQIHKIELLKNIYDLKYIVNN